jgi:serine/threonine-protein kinase
VKSDVPLEDTTALANALRATYRLDRLIGRGGMARVFLADDLRHARRVAIKVMNSELGAAVLSERFLKEIRTTAALQHPHILPLIDSGEADGQLYYVTPYVEGESLRDRLDRERQLPVDEAVRLAREVAAALDYAHRRGVVHRDVKPENVLLQDGQALVADFGIALALSSAGDERLTQTGLSLGTPQYMAPEQLTGERTIDARADIYALGAVTYEMLAGDPPFAAPTAQASAARALTEDPRPLSAHRRSVPPHVDAAVLRALEKLPADRFGTAKEFGDALASGQASFYRARGPGVRRRVASYTGLAIVGAMAVAFAGWSAGRSFGSSRATPAPPSRLAIVPPHLGATGGASVHRQIALSADGSTLLYIVAAENGANQVVRQRLDAAEGTPITGVRNGTTSLLVSPDGLWFIGWLAGERTGYRYPVAGGREEIVSLLGGQTNFADWDDHGSIWFSPINGGGVARLDPGDSASHFLATPGKELRLQQLLPDGRHILAMARASTQTGPVVIFDAKTGETSPLLPGQIVEVRYAVGYLLSVLGNGILQAAPFDVAARRITGPAVTIAEGVSVSTVGVAQFAVARNGTIAYLAVEPQSLVFADRTGIQRAALAERHNYHGPRFSPDGRRVAVDVTGPEGRDVWTLDVGSNRLSRATFDRDGHDVAWTPDGTSITYLSARSGTESIYRKHPGDAGSVAPLFTSGQLGFTGVWLRDSSALVLAANDLHPNSGADVAIVRNGGRGPLVPLVATEFTEAFPAPSPDGHWLAYSSDQSGRPEVYVRALDGSGDPVQLSVDGGTESAWSSDGQHLFYKSTGDQEPAMVDAEVRRGPTLTVLTRHKLFSMSDIVGANPHANFDLSPDGKTFVFVRSSPPTRITVIQNLPALVRNLQTTTSRP